MAIEIVDLPIKNGDFPSLCKRLPEGISLPPISVFFTMTCPANQPPFLQQQIANVKPGFINHGPK